MPSQNNHRIAILSAYALALHSIEAIIPSPIPWLRLGLANIITTTSLVIFGFRTAFMITIVRVLLGSILTGTFLGPAFILSIGGGLAGTTAMGIVHSVAKRLFGPVGLSLIGAIFHNGAQLFLAYFIFIQRFEAIILIAPIIMLIGTLTGFANGLVSDILIKNLLKKPIDKIQNVAGV